MKIESFASHKLVKTMRLIDFAYSNDGSGYGLSGKFTNEENQIIDIQSKLAGKNGIARYLVLIVPVGASQSSGIAHHFNSRELARKMADSLSSGEKASLLSRLNITGKVNAYIIDRSTKRVLKSKSNELEQEEVLEIKRYIRLVLNEVISQELSQDFAAYFSEDEPKEDEEDDIVELDV